MYQLPLLLLEEILMYLRKSRADDPSLTVEEVLANHEKILDDWCERNLGGRIPEENRFREVVSGETIESRPEINKVLRKIESPKYKAVLVVEPQRLSRGDLEDIGRLVKIFRYTNTLVLTERYNYDLVDTRDRDDFERELKRGNEYLEYQKRIMQNGTRLAVERGCYLGTHPPYGYDKTTIKEGGKKLHTLTPNPEQAAIVKRIFEWYVAGVSTHEIAKRLNASGVPTARNKRWTASSIVDIVNNEHYLGLVRWNRRKHVKTIQDGELIVSTPKQKKYTLVPGLHPAIIEQELWDGVRDIIEKRMPQKSKTKCRNPFAGLIFCKCGQPMIYQTHPRSQPRLVCNREPGCGRGSCLASDMHDAVAKALKDAITDIELKIDHSAADSIENHKQFITQLENRLANLRKQELSQWEKYSQDGMPKHIFDQLNAKVLKEIEETKAELDTARETLPEPIDYVQKKAMFSDALDLLEDPCAPALEKNMLLKKCIERIDYDREREVLPEGRSKVVLKPMQLDITLRV